jgi:hypothetical protein
MKLTQAIENFEDKGFLDIHFKKEINYIEEINKLRKEKRRYTSTLLSATRNSRYCRFCWR